MFAAVVYQRMSTADEAGAVGGVAPSPNPNNPSEYCSTIPPPQQATPNSPPPSVMVPVGVLRKEGKAIAVSLSVDMYFTFYM